MIPDYTICHIQYISVKKNTIPFGNDISIYMKNEYGEGIFAFGHISSDIVYKSTELPVQEREKLLNRSYFQIKIKLEYAGRYPLVDIKYLKHFPSYNRNWCQEPKNLFKLYWDAGVTKDIKNIHDKYYDNFLHSNKYDDNMWRYIIHISRENLIKYSKKARNMLINNTCTVCKISSNNENFLEIHDNYDIDFNGEYRHIDINDFIILCPNCHKILHNYIKLGKK